MALPPDPPPRGYRYGVVIYEYAHPFVYEEEYWPRWTRRPWHYTGLWEVWVRDANGTLVAHTKHLWRWVARLKARREVRANPIEVEQIGLIKLGS